jgi:hypothetical protein
MTLDETIKLKKLVLTDLFNKDGYIKGHGPKLCRVMDGEHNPLYNVKRDIVDSLIYEEKIIKNGLVFKLNLES